MTEIGAARPGDSQGSNAFKAALRSFARTWIVDLKGRDIRMTGRQSRPRPQSK